MIQAVLGGVGIAASLAGSIMEGLGASKQAKASAQMYQYRAHVARLNAQINRQNAEWARDRGEKEGLQYGLKAGHQAGQIKVAQAASGFDINTGTAKDVQSSQRKIVGMDLEMIRENAARIAFDYENKAKMDEHQARMDEMAAANAKEAGKFSLLKSIIGGVSSVSSKWQQASSSGLFGDSGGGGGSSGFNPFNVTGSLY
jgi:hypothetical protein